MGESRGNWQPPLAQVFGSTLSNFSFERLPTREDGEPRQPASASITISDANGARVLDLSTTSRRTLCLMCLSCCSLFVLLAACALTPPALMLIYTWAWMVWLMHVMDPCDVPLNAWLGIYLSYAVTTTLWRPLLLKFLCRWTPEFGSNEMPLRVKMMERLTPVVALAWLIYARVLLAQSTTCSETSPGLIGFVRWFSLVAFLPHSLHLSLICIKEVGVVVLLWLARRGALRPLLVWLAGRGLLRANNAANPDAINEMEIVGYDAGMFADPHDPLDTRPQGECCICLDAYDGEQTIRRTPCGHMMHHECLKLWLQAARTCPACRSDVDVPSRPGDEESLS